MLKLLRCCAYIVAFVLAAINCSRDADAEAEAPAGLHSHCITGTLAAAAAAAAPAPSPAPSPAVRVNVDFETEILPNEYIVEFSNYYRRSTRSRYLRAAAHRANITSWRVVPRDNSAAVYPSDFDVLQLDEADPGRAGDQVAILQSHPAIKRVTPHRSVHRVLSYVPRTNLSDGARADQFVGAVDEDGPTYRLHGRHLLRILPKQITSDLHANFLWNLGVTGKGVKIAVFDTGLAKDHPHFRSVKERTNWTNEKSLDDGVSHGTFVAGVIASSKECLGFAPDAELHIYRVFTNTQVSYTSWFLDAFNYAIFRKINILNLSIGGPDFLDRPFVDKVLELSANKVIMVTAIGNDGPLYGTLNNPGDQSDVIGVGGINFDNKVAKFSSRGMTTWELPFGYGRLKPDIVTFGSQVQGSNVRSGCRTLSGTSVASPVVSGAITLIASGCLHKLELLNPASMKQILIEGATRLHDNNMFEQGHGKLNILKSMQLLLTYVPKVTLSPAYLDLTESYMWPYSSQPLFCSSMPIIVNVTILNGIAVTGRVVDTPQWFAYADKGGELLNVAITYSATIWPWSGWMAAHISVNNNGCDFEGVARGHIKLVVENPSSLDKAKTVNSTVYFPLSIKIIPKPPRHKRLLWDQYHSLRYPPGYIPRDNLKIKSDPLDWRADHMHTNFLDLYNHLRSAGYYIDILRMPFTCFNASDYGTLLIVDPEEEFFNEEITKLQSDIYDSGLGVIIFADWYNTTVMKKIKFFDENTRQWWIPDTGGCNIPALNDLLQPFGIAFDDFVAEGIFRLGDHGMHFASGSIIAKFPNYSDNIVIGAELYDQGLEIIDSLNPGVKVKRFVPILGLLQTKHVHRQKYYVESSSVTQSSYEEYTADQSDVMDEMSKEKNPILNKRILLHSNIAAVAGAGAVGAGAGVGGSDDIGIGVGVGVGVGGNAIKSEIHLPGKHRTQHMNPRDGAGRIVVFGDSNCLDSTHLEKACFWLLDALLDYTMNSHKSVLLQNLNRVAEFNLLTEKPLPLRLVSSNLHQYSKVLDSGNKFKRKEIEKCDRLHWAEAVAINSSDIKELIQIASADLVRNIQADKEVLITYFKNKVAVENFSKANKEPISAIKLKGAINSFEDESISFSLVFVIILTLLVILIFINWFIRKGHFGWLIK